MARSSVPATTPRRGQRLWPTALILAFVLAAVAVEPVARLSPGAALVYAVAAVALLGFLVHLRKQHRDITADALRRGGEIRERKAESARREAHWHVNVEAQAELIREEVEFVVRQRLPAALTKAEIPPSLHTREELGEGLADWLDRLLTVVAESVANREESQRLSLVELASRVQTSAHRIQASATGMADRYPNDADLLESTMRVDHAATQQARHAQSLKVLCDEWPGQQWQKPLALVDVVRAASGRIVSFKRVEVSGDPDVGVIPSVVEPLIHLMAELLANATEYSPPKTGVPVTVRTVQRGAVIEVDDGGLGLDEYRLAEAREIVSARRLLGVGDVGEIPQTGFAVVGRFADRHGFSVDLGPSPYGGVRAVVLVPVDVLQTVAPAGTPGGRVLPAAQPVPPTGHAKEAAQEAVRAAASGAPREAGRDAGREAAGDAAPAPEPVAVTAPAPVPVPVPASASVGAGTHVSASAEGPGPVPASVPLSAPAPETRAQTHPQMQAQAQPQAQSQSQPQAQASSVPHAPEPALPQRAIPAQKPTEAAGPPALPSGDTHHTHTRPHTPRTGSRLPQRRSRRDEFAPAVEAAPTAVTPPGSPEEAGDWMEQFFEGGRVVPPSAFTPDSSEGQT
ncbi:ATP-binding protein [Streptomyces sp. 150FB]|uniref:ATP-binding protein n=1 Tax=Streptomyces sp. 150FB TaxID=1576605 RepID=UPI001F18138E|nr:ATP-binding protein [Streptomyces sp. 150FB]